MTHPGWRYHPAAKVALLLALGIGTAEYVGLRSDVLLPCIAFLLAFLVIAVRLPVIFFTLNLALLCVASGALLRVARGPDPQLLPPDVTIERVNVSGRLLLDPKPVAGGWEWRMRPDSLSFRTVVVDPEADLLVRVYDRKAGRGNLPSRGDRVILRGDLRTPPEPFLPGERDYGAWLASEGILGTLQIGRLRDVWTVDSGGAAHAGVRDRFHRFVAGFCAEYIGGEPGGVALALVTGDRSGIDPELRRAFSLTGTAHVLALSGLHVGVLALALFVLLSWIPRRWVRFGLFTAVLAGYVLLTGAGPSILRASLMAVLFLLAYSIGRISQPLNTLGLAGLIILLIDPSSLFDIGFQLSFGAVGGILLFYGRLYRGIDRRAPLLMRYAPVRGLVSLLLLSLTAQLGTFPLIALYFGEFSLLSPLFNVVVVPLITIGFGATCAGLLLSWLPELPLWYGAAASLSLGWGIDLVGWGSSIGWQGLPLPPLAGVTALIMLAGILWSGLSRTLRSATVRIASTLLLLFGLSRFPLGEEGGGGDDFYLIPLNRHAGIALVHHHADSLTLWYGPAWESDSTAVARIAARFERILQTTATEIIPVHGPAVDTTQPRLIPINGYGPEYLDRHVPVLLSLTGRREPDILLLDTHPVLYVPLHARTTQTRIPN